MWRLLALLILIPVSGCEVFHLGKNHAVVTAPLDIELAEYSITSKYQQPVIIHAGVWGRGGDVKLSNTIYLEPGESKTWQPYRTARRDFLALDPLNGQLLHNKQPFAEYTLQVFEVNQGTAGKLLHAIRSQPQSCDFNVDPPAGKLVITKK